MSRLLSFFADPRRWICYGGGFLLIGIATVPFFLSRPDPTPPIKDPPPGVWIPPETSREHDPPMTRRGYGFPIGLYVLGFLLLLAGGRSESEKRGYHF